eukprot:NODE_3439_length_774_cov_84.670345_g2874_i0.p1 GENE.NODE_3439_length_774_cov_84.670345_g2874_i0~~NODE_3439_length_774_cov_84.670345_g2874_i0.p1  ORF type:complete len:122 (-),score=15.52 NODE_3439_length_774_cov_84.670345_g2874_i0:145-510(-)
MYDCWGNTVNLAARLESHSGAGRILVSYSLYNAVISKDTEFQFSSARRVFAKGIGAVSAYYVIYSKSAPKELIELLELEYNLPGFTYEAPVSYSNPSTSNMGSHRTSRSNTSNLDPAHDNM